VFRNDKLDRESESINWVSGDYKAGEKLAFSRESTSKDANKRRWKRQKLAPHKVVRGITKIDENTTGNERVL